MIKGFKDFVMGGNLIDLAIAFVLGLAFAALTKSFTDNLINPIVGIFGGTDGLNGISFTINHSRFNVGLFLADAITFITTMAAIYFFIVVPYTKIRKPAAPGGPSEIELLTEIRDSLKAGR